ncbi:hypothetical protein R3P38DRAFT_3039771, partial [Favolaschia claudopus]
MIIWVSIGFPIALAVIYVVSLEFGYLVYESVLNRFGVRALSDIPRLLLQMRITGIRLYSPKRERGAGFSVRVGCWFAHVLRSLKAANKKAAEQRVPEAQRTNEWHGGLLQCEPKSDSLTDSVAVREKSCSKNKL